MKLKEIVEKLNLQVKSGESYLEREVSGGYVSDLLSDVMGNAKKDYIWITLQTHQNIVAVATLKELAGIILVSERVPEEEVLKKAEEEKIPILIGTLPAFEIVGRLYMLGIKGSDG